MKERFLPVTPHEQMAEASRELQAAYAEFDMALTAEEVTAACARILAAQAKVALILADARRQREGLRCTA